MKPASRKPTQHLTFLLTEGEVIILIWSTSYLLPHDLLFYCNHSFITAAVTFRTYEMDLNATNLFSILTHT